MSRVALYVDYVGTGLVSCARAARLRGDRVVLVARERASGTRRRSLGLVLRRLVARMQAGEFEAVVAALDSAGPPVRLVVQNTPGNSKETQPNDGATHARCAAIDQGGSPIGEQVGRLQDHAASWGWKVVGTYVYPASTGLTLAGRPGFTNLLAAAERGAFQVLPVNDIDRLSRNAADRLGVMKDLKAMGVVIRTSDDTPPRDMEAQVVTRIFEDYVAVGVGDDTRDDDESHGC